MDLTPRQINRICYDLYDRATRELMEQGVLQPPRPNAVSMLFDRYVAEGRASFVLVDDRRQLRVVPAAFETFRAEVDDIVQAFVTERAPRGLSEFHNVSSDWQKILAHSRAAFEPTSGYLIATDRADLAHAVARFAKMRDASEIPNANLAYLRPELARLGAVVVVGAGGTPTAVCPTLEAAAKVRGRLAEVSLATEPERAKLLSVVETDRDLRTYLFPGLTMPEIGETVRAYDRATFDELRDRGRTYFVEREDRRFARETITGVDGREDDLESKRGAAPPASGNTRSDQAQETQRTRRADRANRDAENYAEREEAELAKIREVIATIAKREPENWPYRESSERIARLMASLPTQRESAIEAELFPERMQAFKSDHKAWTAENTVLERARAAAAARLGIQDDGDGAITVDFNERDEERSVDELERDLANAESRLLEHGDRRPTPPTRPGHSWHVQPLNIGFRPSFHIVVARGNEMCIVPLSAVTRHVVGIEALENGDSRVGPPDAKVVKDWVNSDVPLVLSAYRENGENQVGLQIFGERSATIEQRRKREAMKEAERTTAAQERAEYSRLLQDDLRASRAVARDMVANLVGIVPASVLAVGFEDRCDFTIDDDNVAVPNVHFGTKVADGTYTSWVWDGNVLTPHAAAALAAFEIGDQLAIEYDYEGRGPTGQPKPGIFARVERRGIEPMIRDYADRFDKDGARARQKAIVEREGPLVVETLRDERGTPRIIEFQQGMTDIVEVVRVERGVVFAIPALERDDASVHDRIVYAIDARIADMILETGMVATIAARTDGSLSVQDAYTRDGEAIAPNNERLVRTLDELRDVSTHALALNTIAERFGITADRLTAAPGDRNRPYEHVLTTNRALYAVQANPETQLWHFATHDTFRSESRARATANDEKRPREAAERHSLGGNYDYTAAEIEAFGYAVLSHTGKLLPITPEIADRLKLDPVVPQQLTIVESSFSRRGSETSEMARHREYLAVEISRLEELQKESSVLEADVRMLIALRDKLGTELSAKSSAAMQRALDGMDRDLEHAARDVDDTSAHLDNLEQTVLERGPFGEQFPAEARFEHFRGSTSRLTTVIDNIEGSLAISAGSVGGIASFALIASDDLDASTLAVARGLKAGDALVVAIGDRGELVLTPVENDGVTRRANGIEPLSIHGPSVDEPVLEVADDDRDDDREPEFELDEEQRTAIRSQSGGR
jgi:hypothetical protein